MYVFNTLNLSIFSSISVELVKFVNIIAVSYICIYIYSSKNFSVFDCRKKCFRQKLYDLKGNIRIMVKLI